MTEEERKRENLNSKGKINANRREMKAKWKTEQQILAYRGRGENITLKEERKYDFPFFGSIPVDHSFCVSFTP
jgi:hypothetical protein